MKIAILCRNPDLYSHQRLLEAAESRGHHVKMINPLAVYMNISSHHPEIRYHGEILKGFNAIIPRIGASITFYGLAVLRQFEMMGVYPLNSSPAISRSRDKLHTLQLLAGAGLPLPVTGFAHGTQFADDIIHMVGGAPVVVKLLEGTQGIGVVLGETHSSARSMIEAFRKIEANILVQEYIKEAAGSDIRCFVIGNKVVAAMKRQGSKGDFRSNIHRGGGAIAIKITPEERSMAVQAAKLLGLNIAGVDMLRSDKGPMIMEVNSSPGLEGIEKATHVDIAGKMIEFLEKNVTASNKMIKKFTKVEI